MKQTQLKVVTYTAVLFWWIYNMLVSHLPRFYAGKARPKERERHVLPQTSVRGGVINLGLARRATSNVTAIYRAVYAGQS